jgi:flagellar hook-associated protein 3
MGIQSVQVSRVTTTLRSESLLSSLRQNQNDLYRQQSRLSLGRAYLTPSENPVAAGQALTLRDFITSGEQLIENTRHGSNVLGATDEALNEVNNLLNEAHSLALENVNSLSSPEEREASAELVSSVIGQLVSVGNRRFQDAYLFSGRTTSRTPFESALGGVAYLGDVGDRLVRTDVGQDASINLTGDILFGGLSGRITGTTDLMPLLTENTRLENLNGATGRGIQPGRLVIQEASGDQPIRINISGADTIGAVINRINSAAAESESSISASLGDFGIVIDGTGEFTVLDDNGGATASSLGVFTSEPTSGTVEGADLGVRLSMTTLLADLGAEIDIDNGFVLRNGTSSTTIAFEGLATVQDLINRINNSGLYVEAGIGESGRNLELTNLVSGSTMIVEELEGGTSAADLGLVTFGNQTLLSSLNDGNGVSRLSGQPDLRFETSEGYVEVNLDQAVTIGDVIDIINDAADEAGINVAAELSPTGLGLQITGPTGSPGEPSVTILSPNGSLAAIDLGLAARSTPSTQRSNLGTSIASPTIGETGELIGVDIGGARAGGVLTALVDLEAALRRDDDIAISDAGERLRNFTDDLIAVRGSIGARARGMESRASETEEAIFSTRNFLSEIEDLDFTEAVTRFQEAQTSLQASLLTGARIQSLSLLDYLG